MATYAIGDVQGCFDELRALLEVLQFDSRTDTLWLVGDIVNRGPRSLDVLRFVIGLEDRAITVLGNHELNLLAVAGGYREYKPSDTIEDILSAPDRSGLLDWLRHRPLMHRDAAKNFIMVHAGFAPQWDAETAHRCAREVEAVLQGPNLDQYLGCMYGNEPDAWRTDLTGGARLRFITNSLTRIRYCDADGRLILDQDGAPPGPTPPNAVPWFDVSGRRSAGERIVFGHWATLQLEETLDRDDVFHLDTGCVWGKRLTAMRLEDQTYFSVPCVGRGGKR